MLIKFLFSFFFSFSIYLIRTEPAQFLQTRFGPEPARPR